VLVVVGLAVVVAVAAVWRAERAPSKPAPPKPSASKQFGDDADLMRRLQRHNLMTTSR
jgi:hypothetical protein